MARKATTVDKVIQELGGLTQTARLTGRTAQHVYNWRKAGRLPAYTYLALTSALHERGCAAPAKLWGMVERAEPVS